MQKTLKNHLAKRGKKILGLVLSLAVILSLSVPAVMAEATVDEDSTKITLSYAPGCLQIDSNGKIYVGDWSYGYLYRYNADGSLDTAWGNSGKADGVSISGTVGMCLDNNGNIIVTGQNTDSLYRVNKDTGAVMNSVTVSGPLGCNIDADGNIYVGAHSGIYKYDSNFNLLNSTTLFTEVFGIAANSDGKIYITTTGSNKVYRLNSDLTLDTTFGTDGGVVVFNADYADNLLIYGGKLYTSSELDNACYSLNLDGTNVTQIITGAGPTQVVITGDSYAVPFWSGFYIQIFKRPEINLENDNFSFTMNPLKVTEGSTTPINFTIESTSTKNYTVKAQLINKLTGSVVSDVSSTTATLQDGGAMVTLTPPAEGWTKGIYGIAMIFSNTVGSITLSDTLDVGILMGVGYYAINYNAPSNGTISGKTEYVEIAPDAQATFTVDPDQGYTLDTANTTVTNADVQFDGNQVTLKNITGDVNVNVAFKEVSAKQLLEDPATGIKLEGVDGTTFDADTELIVTPIKDTLDASKKSLFALNVANASGGQEIVQLYDIRLMLAGQEVQPNGRVKITLKLTDAMKNYTDLHITYIAENGDVTIIPCERSGDELVFYTDHFSNYGIIGTPSKVPNTGDEFPLLYLPIAGTALLLLVITGRKKRSISIS